MLQLLLGTTHSKGKTHSDNVFAEGAHIFGINENGNVAGINVMVNSD